MVKNKLSGGQKLWITPAGIWIPLIHLAKQVPKGKIYKVKWSKSYKGYRTDMKARSAEMKKWLQTGISSFMNWYHLNPQTLKLIPSLTWGRDFRGSSAADILEWSRGFQFSFGRQECIHIESWISGSQKAIPCCPSTILGIASKVSQMETFIHFQILAIAPWRGTCEILFPLCL